MMANGRPADQDFAAEERLFRRYKAEHYIAGQFTGLGLRLSNAPSVNRERYSVPEDVIFSETDEFAEWGVLSWRVQDVLLALPEAAPQYAFRAVHVPLENNYAHSELVCSSAQEPNGAHVEPNSGTKKLFRTLMGQRAIVVIQATA
jgi:hypothetical protein